MPAIDADVGIDHGCESEAPASRRGLEIPAAVFLDEEARREASAVGAGCGATLAGAGGLRHATCISIDLGEQLALLGRRLIGDLILGGVAIWGDRSPASQHERWPAQGTGDLLEVGVESAGQRMTAAMIFPGQPKEFPLAGASVAARAKLEAGRRHQPGAAGLGRRNLALGDLIRRSTTARSEASSVQSEIKR
jgi:hypothetical protein